MSLTSPSSSPDRKVIFVTQYYGKAGGGLGRYEDYIVPYLIRNYGVETTPIQPYKLPSSLTSFVKALGSDLLTFTNNYPCKFENPYPNSLVHLTNQNLALALRMNRMERSLITVQDIITYVEMVEGKAPYITDPLTRLMIKLDVQTIQLADAIISVSEYTKKQVVEYLGIAAEKIYVIPNAVDHKAFYPRSKSEIDDFRAQYNLSTDYHYITYVGSRHRRKNLPFLCEVMGEVCREIPSARLLLVGNPGTTEQQSALSSVIEQAGITDKTQSIPFLDATHLSALYGASTLFAYPSLYEGFGIPPLEAMASGCVVLTSNTTSLPEVVLDAGIQLDPTDHRAWKEAMISVINDSSKRADYYERGLKRAQAFSWESSANQTIDLYRRLS